LPVAVGSKSIAGIHAPVTLARAPNGQINTTQVNFMICGF
jgi:hypothetical protein